jgi:hypothetical protein
MQRKSGEIAVGPQLRTDRGELSGFGALIN